MFESTVVIELWRYVSLTYIITVLLVLLKIIIICLIAIAHCMGQIIQEAQLLQKDPHCRVG